MPIPFNKPFFTGDEITFIQQAIKNGKISGDGSYTKQCQSYFEEKFNFRKTLLTTSCTDALELCALLLDIKEGDEVIMPSFTFVSTANAFALRGATIVFADCFAEYPNMDPQHVKTLITKKTKAIVTIHYGGVGMGIRELKELAVDNDLFLVEDAAQAVGASYDNTPLGNFGHLATLSFHDTKNITCGEGGMLVINDDRFIKRAEIIREKGTNRAAFFRGEVDKYGWVDIGSSFLMSDLSAAFLLGQLQKLELINSLRMEAWLLYQKELEPLQQSGEVLLPQFSAINGHNAHTFYLICQSLEERTDLIAYLKNQGISASFHYTSLHKSPYGRKHYYSPVLTNAETFSDQLVRLPLYADITKNEVLEVCRSVYAFYQGARAQAKSFIMNAIAQ